MTLALPLLLGACAGPQQRMTQAALMGDTAAMDSLLNSGSPEVNTPVPLDRAQPACPGQRTLTPLQAAACAGQEGIVKKLLARKADIDLAAGAGQPPLLLAMTNGHDDVVRLLVRSGARLESTDAAGNTVLLLSAGKGNTALTEFLLKSGASPQARNRAGETALLLSTDPGIAKMLVGLGSDPLVLNAKGESGLHVAARNRNAEMARFFLERGVDVGLRSKSGATALDLARAGAAGEGRLSPGADAQSALRSRRIQAASQMRLGLPPGASAQAAPPDPEHARKQAAVIAVLEERLGQELRKELAAGDEAARQGRSDEALALYAAALSRADEVGGAYAQDLRVKIVRYAAAMPEPPAMPEKAREHLVRSSYLLKKGQDVGLVEKEMAAALRIAPWWVEGYFNIGQLQAQQKKFPQAERNLKLFIAAAPGDPRARAAQDKIFEIGMEKEEEQKIRGMQGRWVDGNGRGYAVSIGGDKVQIRSDGGLVFTLTQRNGVIEGSVQGNSYAGGHGCTIPGQMHPVNGKLAPDARGISIEYLWSNYKVHFHCVNMMGVPSGCCLLCDEVCDPATITSTDRVVLQLRPAK
ncbi:MAG: ankyrin repeat domain-containing protein [Candidatus Deferrimicrobium sp.]|nr:ankyrin repeat domain-containing protein [Candidatus Deferrimicrobium sp.]